MKVRVLGCNGGVGEGSGTTSLLVDDDVLIDAGTGVESLTLDEMEKITHILLTHSHLDHIAGIPFLVDTIFDRIKTPIQIVGLPATIDALREHIFNWKIWPDFSELPTKDKPVMAYSTIDDTQTFESRGRIFQPVSMNHVVPTIGYLVSKKGKAFAFSGDTTTNDHFWEVLNNEKKLDLLLVETAFSNKDLQLSKLAGHYCPQLIAEDLKKLRHQCPVYLSHAKPGERENIFDECKAAISTHTLYSLQGGEVFEL